MRSIKIALLMMLLFTTILSAQIYLAAIEVHFSPGNSDSVVIAHINSAEKNIRLAIYSLTDSTIAESLIRAFDRGIDIKIIWDKTQAGIQSAQDERLEAAGIEVIRDNEGGLMHDKYCIIDETTILTGSFNWTQNAIKNNRENLLVIHDSDIVEEFEIDFFDMYEKMKEQ